MMSSLSLTPSLKKLQSFRFEEEELMVVPHTSVEIYGSTEVSTDDFERFHICCFMMAIRLLKFDRALALCEHIKFKNPRAVTELSSEKDLAYYVTVSLISCRDYNSISKKSSDPVIWNFLSRDQHSKECISNLQRNNWKKAVFSLKKILDWLKLDPIIGSKVQETTRLCYTSIIYMYLEAFTFIKIDVLANDLDLTTREVYDYLESEIKRKRLSFLINKVGGYIERKEQPQTYTDLFSRSIGMLASSNQKSLEKLVQAQFGSKGEGRGFGGGAMDMIDGDSDGDDVEGISEMRNMAIGDHKPNKRSRRG